MIMKLGQNKYLLEINSSEMKVQEIIENEILEVKTEPIEQPKEKRKYVKKKQDFDAEFEEFDYLDDINEEDWKDFPESPENSKEIKIPEYDI